MRMIENPFLQLQIQDESNILFTSVMIPSIISKEKKVNLLTIGNSVSGTSCHPMAVLDIDIYFLIQVNPNIFCCSLLLLSLHTIPGIRSLPPNRLQKVSIHRF